jgi:hypothetical protein
LDNFIEIQSVVKDFKFFLQEKWKIAIDRPGSGNTKNIGSESKISRLLEGDGLFVREYGEEGYKKFDSYWMNYLTKDMAKEAGMDNPMFNSLTTYKKWVSSLDS